MNTNDDSDPTEAGAHPEEYITFIKRFNPYNDENEYEVRLYSDARVQIPISIDIEPGSRAAVVFDLEAGARVPEKDFMLILKHAAGYIFEIISPIEKSRYPQQAAKLKRIVSDPEAIERMKAGGTFKTTIGTFHPVPDEASDHVKEMLSRAQDLIKHFKADTERKDP